MVEGGRRNVHIKNVGQTAFLEAGRQEGTLALVRPNGENEVEIENEKESEERMKLMEMKAILEKEAKKARFLGLGKVKKGSTSNSIPKSVMPTRPDHKFRGKYLESRRNINFAAILATN